MLQKDKMKSLLLNCYIVVSLVLTNQSHADEYLQSKITNKDARFLDLKELDKSGLKGEIVYAFGNAELTPAGLKWPWDNLLIRRQVDQPQAIEKLEISTAPYQFVFEPQFLGDGSVLIKTGDITSSSATYNLYRKVPNDAQAFLVAKDLRWHLVHTSPNSRYVSYIQETQLNSEEGNNSLLLRIFDLSSKSEVIWKGINPLLGSISWTPSNTLLYSVGRSSDFKSADWKPDIYEVDPTSGRGRVLIANAVRGVASPNNQFLSYISLSVPKTDPKNGQSPDIIPDPTLPQPSKTSLVVSQRDGSNAYVVKKGISSPPSVLWLVDSSAFILCEEQYLGSDKKGSNNFRVLVSRFDLISKKLTIVGNVSYKSMPDSAISEDRPLWRPLSISKSGDSLFYELSATATEELPGQQLWRFDLLTGERQMLASIDTFLGLDFRETGKEFDVQITQ